jgi:hypothetical protein
MEYEPEESAELELTPEEASLDFLQKVYRSPRQPLAVRMRAAAIALREPQANSDGSQQHEWERLRRDA